MSKQTAVEWLWQQMDDLIIYQRFIHLLEKAKAMEKEQIKESYVSGWLTALNNTIDGNSKFKNCEQYYNETYKGGQNGI